MNTEPIKVAIYARVSTEEQAEHGYSIDAQLDTLRNYCQMYGRVIHDEYVDSGVSGKSMTNRLELKRLLWDAEKHMFDEVLVWKINRLARKNIDLLQIVDLLDKNNIAFRSFSENFETATPMGKFALQMMGAVGELERNTIVDNVKMGMKQRAKTGLHNGKVPLGYRAVLNSNISSYDSNLVVVPDEALIVTKIFELYASGRGLKSIANEFNHTGYKTKKGNPFSTSAVKDILRNPMYAGKIRYNQHENWNEKRRRGKNAEPIIVDGKHPAIISEELWERVQQMINKRSFLPPRTFNGEYLLTGLIRCPQCGGAMVASRTKSKLKNGETKINMYYSCGNFRNKGSSVCSANSIRKEEAEEYVFNRLKTVLTQEKLLKRLIEKMNDKLKHRTRPLQQELQHVAQQILKLEAMKARYMELYEHNQLDKSLFSNRVQEIQSDLEKLKAERSRLVFEIGDDNIQPISYEKVKDALSKLDQVLASASFEQRKTLLHMMISKITVSNAKKIEHIEMKFYSASSLGNNERQHLIM